MTTEAYDRLQDLAWRLSGKVKELERRNAELEATLARNIEGALKAKAEELLAKAAKDRKLADNSGESDGPWAYQTEAAARAKVYAAVANELLALLTPPDVKCKLQEKY